MKQLSKVLAISLCLCALMAFVACSSSSGSSASSAPSSSSASASAAMDTKDAEAPREPLSYTEPFYVLVTGNDSRTGTVEIDQDYYANGLGRTDTMMLVRIDPANYRLSIVSIARDTAAEVDGNVAKINTAYTAHGMQGTLDQVEALTGVRPQYYLNMTFVQFENFINQLGGIDVHVPVDMSLQDIVSGNDISLAAGDQHLDGAEALVLARVRKIYLENLDAVRQGNDRAIVEAGIRMVAANPAIAASATEIMVENCDTNWELIDLEALVKDFCDHAGQITIVSGTGPFDGGIDDRTGEWLATRDEETWRAVIDAVNAGGNPADIVPLPELLVG